ncbi:MAG TPA: DNA-3-methyladenine glycosylase I [Thermoanaerobaculia bacterium]|nr:DNA-3-methyladenine glycosylase I [Thermoanaerobaculia bacterium]HQN09568.1 DNA-3-methyladenine glycosylase I [Thermoanaerobaculia bacterium]HQP85345.1 DNA-3-methyladenine glycosylase I [Thermoanaerobaculia bacterium]
MLEGTRCPWAGSDPLYVAYHDEEWGVPSRDERHLFEMLVLEGAQAGLSWLTVLRKREGYRRAFAGFDPGRVARFGPGDVERLLGDAGIVRNRLKIESAIDSARAYLALQKEAGSFASWLWAHVGGRPIQGAFREMRDVPAKTPLAESISKELRKRGFRFVGPTIVYAYLQAVGVVNDHLVGCPRHRAVARLAKGSPR